MNKISLQEFKEKVFAFIESLEPRRESFLRKHLIALGLFALFALSAPFLQDALSIGLSSNINAVDAETLSKIVCFGFLPFGFLWRAFYMVKLYKNEGKNIYEGESLKNIIFNKIVSLLSNFQFSDVQDINPAHLKESYLMGDFTKFYSEDIIYGNYSNCIIRMGEVFMANNKHGKEFEGFAGMVISIDFSNSELILRHHFTGNTVVLVDEKKNQEKFKKRFADFKRVDFNDDKLEDLFEIYSTDVGEAKSFIRPQLFEILEKLYLRIKAANKQVLHKDDALTGLLEKASNFVINNIALGAVKLVFAPIHFVIGLITGKSNSNVKVNDLPATNFDMKNLRVKNKDKNIEVAFFEDKLLIKMPYDKNLFQPNSIYQKPIIEEDLEIIYSLIDTVKQITDYTVEMRAV